MLTIRMQRTGRKRHAMFRVVVQDSRQSPTSGKVVAALGSYDPHAKTTTLDKEKAAFYLEHGAQPSDRAVRLLKSEGVKLPTWVKPPVVKERAVRNAEKRRSTAPEKPAEKPADEAPAETATEASAEPAEEVAAAETTANADEKAEAKPEAEGTSTEKTDREAPAETETPEAEASTASDETAGDEEKAA